MAEGTPLLPQHFLDVRSLLALRVPPCGPTAALQQASLSSPLSSHVTPLFKALLGRGTATSPRPLQPSFAVVTPWAHSCPVYVSLDLDT